MFFQAVGLPNEADKDDNAVHEEEDGEEQEIAQREFSERILRILHPTAAFLFGDHEVAVQIEIGVAFCLRFIPSDSLSPTTNSA